MLRRLAKRVAFGPASCVGLPVVAPVGTTMSSSLRSLHTAGQPKAGESGSPLEGSQHTHPAHLRVINLNKLSCIDEIGGTPPMWNNPMEHPVWDLKEIERVEINHKPFDSFADRLAYLSVYCLKHGFDLIAGFKTGRRTEAKYIRRCIFLESVAGVPGMVAGMLRHMTSLRRMQRDFGWIHTLLDEAENERMHLLTFLEVRKPGPLFRLAVLGAQGIFFNGFFLCYLISPKFCHRFVGYLEETAVHTYTEFVRDIDQGKLPDFVKLKAPTVAVSYWRLPADATFRDVIVSIRADEAGHRLVNHTFADMHQRRLQYTTNPFVGRSTMTAQPTGAGGKTATATTASTAGSK